MNIIYDVLAELGYWAKSEFYSNYQIGDIQKSISIMPFVSEEYESQVYLVVNCANAQLDEVIESDYIKAIAKVFRKQEFHIGEMDRNTSLLILSSHNVDESINTSAKVKIEDDPYYFKKYVLSYSELAKSKSELWLSHNLKKGSLVTAIQEYIGDTNKFDDYKTNHLNEEVYSYFIELVTKIPNFPMRIVEQQRIQSVDTFLQEELTKLRTKKRNPIDIITEDLDNILKLDIKEMELDDILATWIQISVLKGDK